MISLQCKVSVEEEVLMSGVAAAAVIVVSAVFGQAQEPGNTGMACCFEQPDRVLAGVRALLEPAEEDLSSVADRCDTLPCGSLK
jgi:hypothetical protein